MSTTINAKDIQELLQRFNNMDHKILKANLQHVCRSMYDKGDKPKFAKKSGLTTSQFYAIVNPAHSSKVTFDNFITLCNNLNLDINEMLTDNNLPENYNNQSRYWTDKHKQEFIDYVAEHGITATTEEYRLSDKTVLHYNNLYTKELKG